MSSRVRAIRPCIIGLLLLAALPCFPPLHAHAQTFTATNVTDLINDIAAANTNGGTNTIGLVAGTVYTLTTDTPAGSGTGLPQITGDLTITGNGATIVRSAAGGTPNFRFFVVRAGGTLRLNAVTLRNGHAAGTVGANGGDGNVSHRDGIGGTNGGAGSGGAILNNGTLFVTASTFDANSATGGAGGNGGNGVSDPTILPGSGGNGGTGGAAIGGAIASGGGLTIVNSTFTSNTATGGIGGNGGNGGIGIGGAIGTGGNGATGGGGQGGAIAITGAGSLTIMNDTIAGNTATGVAGGTGQNPGGTGVANGGGIANNGSGSAMAVNVLLAANAASGDGNCSGFGLADNGYNLEFNPATTCGFANHTQTGDPQLGALADHGGPTWTMAIGAGGAARGNGNPAVCSASLVGGMDQRGLPRPLGQCSIGAFEWQATPSLSAVGPSAGPLGGGSRVTLMGAGFLTGATVTFGTAPATIVAVSATAITVTTPAHSAGAVDVVVTNPDRQVTMLSGVYTFAALTPLPGPQPYGPPSSGPASPLPPTRPTGGSVGNSPPIPLPIRR